MSCHWREVKGADLIYAAVWAREYEHATKAFSEGPFRDRIEPTHAQLAQAAAHAAKKAHEAVQAFEDAGRHIDDERARITYDVFR